MLESASERPRMWDAKLRLLIIVVVIVVLFIGRKSKPRRPPTHPLPVTGPIETTLRLIQRAIRDVWTI